MPDVGGGQLAGERASDRLWRAEVVDRRLDGLVFGVPVGGVIGDRLVETVAELGEDLFATPTWAA